MLYMLTVVEGCWNIVYNGSVKLKAWGPLVSIRLT